MADADNESNHDSNEDKTDNKSDNGPDNEPEEESDYEARIDAFFKEFEIPELHNIDLLESSTAKWHSLPKPPSIGKKKGRLLFYHSMCDNKDYIIIITHKKGIDSYDIENNTYKHLTDFPENFKCKGSEIAINNLNGDLYLIGGTSKCFGIYNIESNIWDIKCLNRDDDKCHMYSLNSVDNSPKIIDNTLYINGWDTNRWYNNEQDKFIDISQENNTAKYAPTSNKDTKMIYNKTLNKYIHFGSDSSFIFSSSLSNEIWFFGKHENNECLWYLSEIGLPSVYKKMTLKFVLSYESIIILIYLSKDDDLTDSGLDIQNEIWCLDLESNEWNKGKANFDNIEQDKNINFNQYKLFITDNGKIHLIRLDGDNRIHLFVYLSDMIDDRLYKKYNNKYKCVVNGFSKSIIKHINKPFDLANCLRIILSYYTIFK